MERRRLRPLAAAGLVAVLFAACGGDDGDGAEPEATSTSAAAALDAELATALLTPADLDSGDPLDARWAVGDVAQGVDITLPDCVTEEADPTALASAEAKLVTDVDLKLPSVEEDLAAFADSASALAAFEGAAARLDACDAAFTFQGATAQGSITRLELAPAGDRSAAWRTTVTIAGAQVAITNVHVVQGDRELALVHVDLGTPDPAVLDELVATAVAKV